MTNYPPDDTKPLSKSEEERLLKAGRSVFATAFPNPKREGCPSREVIEAIARHKADPAQHRDFMVHMSRCSPCFNDFSMFRKAAQREKRMKVFATAAVIVVVCVAAWLVVRARHSTPSSYSAAYDLGTRMMLRGFGEKGKQAHGPMVLRKGIAHLTLLLPPGSRTGPYEVGVILESGKVLMTAPAATTVIDGRTAIKVQLDLSKLHSGQYLLGIRPPGVEWSYYSLSLR